MFIILASLLVSTAIAEEKVPTVDSIARHAERKYKLPHGLIGAVIKVESNGNAAAYALDDGTHAQKAAGRVVGSRGLMQIQVATARHMGFRGHPLDLHAPSINIEFGARYLSWLYEKNGKDVSQTLTCYNSGPASEVCQQKQYTKYVGKVLNAWVLPAGRFPAATPQPRSDRLSPKPRSGQTLQ